MDNGNKITPETQEKSVALIEKSKALFLREIIDEFKGKQTSYDLGLEFAKTKKNRNFFISAIVLGIIILFTVGAVVTTYYIQENSKNITVDIKEFRDINLQELLDSAKKFEHKLNQARLELDKLIKKQDMAIKSREDDTERQIFIVQNGDDTNEVKQRKINALYNTSNIEIGLIKERYIPLIEKKEAEIADLERSIAEYDRKQIQLARRQEENLNNQQRLFDLEMTRLSQFYEQEIDEMNNKYNADINALEAYNTAMAATLNTTHAREISRMQKQHTDEIAALMQRYNPTFTDDTVTSMINAPLNVRVYTRKTSGNFRPILDSENVLTQEEYLQLSSASDSFHTIMRRLKKIPYENSIPSAIRQMDYQHRQSMSTYEDVWNSLADKVITKNTKIDQLFYALEYLTSTQRENGYILDPRDSENIIVYIDKFLDIENETLGLVFRYDDEPIAQIKITLEESGVKASLLKLENEEVRLQPYDKILIEVK